MTYNYVVNQRIAIYIYYSLICNGIGITGYAHG